MNTITATKPMGFRERILHAPNKKEVEAELSHAKTLNLSPRYMGRLERAAKRRLAQLDSGLEKPAAAATTAGSSKVNVPQKRKTYAGNFSAKKPGSTAKGIGN